jgi:hypothetical protein
MTLDVLDVSDEVLGAEVAALTRPQRANALVKLLRRPLRPATRWERFCAQLQAALLDAERRDDP